MVWRAVLREVADRDQRHSLQSRHCQRLVLVGQSFPHWKTPHLCSGKAREGDTMRQSDSRQVKNKSKTHKWRHSWQKAGRVEFPVHLNKGKWKPKVVHVLKKQRGKETWSVWKQIARKGSSGRHRSSSELFTLARAGWKSASLVKWVLSSVLCFYFFNSGSPHFPIWF